MLSPTKAQKQKHQVFGRETFFITWQFC